MVNNSNNKFLRKRSNRFLVARRNYYVVGGPIVKSPIVPIDSGMGGAQDPNRGYSASGSSVPAGTGVDWGNMASMGASAAQGIVGMIDNIQSQDIKDDADNRVASANKAQVSQVSGADSYDRIFSDYANTNPLEHVTKQQMGAMSAGQMIGSALGSAASGAAGGMSGGPVMAGISAGVNTLTSLIGSAARNRQAAKAARKVNEAIDRTNAYNEMAFANRLDNAASAQMNNLLINSAAYGGPLFAEGGRIHISSENRGKFTETKRRTGKTTEELTHSKNPLTRKRAIFAQNARKWRHAFGGDLLTHGANFDTGVTIVGNGGTHEENPYEGVPMGVDNEGTPNLVEQGEVIFDDYVFSNRLKVPKEVRERYKLRGTKPLTFAEAAIQMSKESEERPNDPISKAGLERNMMNLMMAQEDLREKGNKTRKYARGGRLGRLFAGLDTDPYPNILRRGFAITPFEGSDPVYVTGPGYASGYIPSVPDKGSNLVNSDATNNVDLPPVTGDIKGYSTDVEGYPTGLRYLPAYASGFMALTDALDITNKPDYSEADMVLDASRGVASYSPVKFQSVGNYLEYNPFDREFYIKQMNAQAGSTRRAVMQNAGLNRGTGMAALLALDHNSQSQLGQLARQAEEYNLAQRQKVEEFNRATNMFNSEGKLKADVANQEALLKTRDTYLKGTLSAAELRQRERQQSAATRSANLSNFINSLGDIGRENFERNMIISDPSKYYWIDNKGMVHYKGAYDRLSSDEKKKVDSEIKSKTGSKANEGYLTRRNKRR